MEQKTDKDLRWYVAELRSEQCLCERPKKAGCSFCYRCYKELPREMQKVLYYMVGFGYEEGFEEAVKWLQENVW